MASIEATDARMEAMQAVVRSADEAVRPELSKAQVAAFMESLAKLKETRVDVSQAVSYTHLTLPTTPYV